MIRALTILTAVVALAVSAQPASAGSNVSNGATDGQMLYVANHTTGTVSVRSQSPRSSDFLPEVDDEVLLKNGGIVTNNNDPEAMVVDADLNQPDMRRALADHPLATISRP